jgi:hypothetical protein
MEELTITVDKKTCKPTFGGTQLEVEYIMKHVKYGRVNLYRVTCDIVGLESADPHLFTQEAEFIGDLEKDSNDETLTNQAVMDLFEEHYC